MRVMTNTAITHRDGDLQQHSRRRTVASLLVFAKELERAGRISNAGKGLLKELIVHENTDVMSVGDSLARDDGAEGGVCLVDILEEQIRWRACKSHEELFQICSLEQAHLLSQRDTEALSPDSDTKSLVYGEIDFLSFYDVVKMTIDGIDTSGRVQNRSGCSDPRSVNAVNKTTSPPRQEEEEQEQEEEQQQQQQQQQQNMKRRITENGRERAAQSREEIPIVEDKAEEEGGREDDAGTPALCDDRKVLSTGAISIFNSCHKPVEGNKMSTIKAIDATVAVGGQRGAVEESTLQRPAAGTLNGLKFYDLGSGSGKAVFAAVLAGDFRCAVGIEILAGVHRASKRIFKRYKRLVEPVLCAPTLIELHHGSFLAPEFDWTDGDVVFANSTCFAEDTLDAIADRACLLRTGARIVTFTATLKTPWLRVLIKRRYQMSWGPATVFVHQKLSPEEYARSAKDTTRASRQGQGIRSSPPRTRNADRTDSRIGTMTPPALAPTSSSDSSLGDCCDIGDPTHLCTGGGRMGFGAVGGSVCSAEGIEEGGESIDRDSDEAFPFSPRRPSCL